MTKCTGLLEKLEPRDNIIAHRGLDIADIFPSGVTVNVSPLNVGKDQLNSEETDEKAIIAPVRIHVDRAIG